MKGYFTFAIGMSLLFIACKKGSDAPSSGNGSQPPKKGTITITGISPQNPHPDNTITITGTGFNADASKDIVYFGNYDTTTKVFRAYADGHTIDYESTIYSASATGLTFKTLDSSLLNLDVMDAPKYRKVPAIQVIANGDTAVMPVYFKEMVRLARVYDPLQLRQAIPDGWPNDSLIVDCNGPVDKTASLTIDGMQCAFTTEDVPTNTEHETLLHTLVPKALAVSNNDTVMAPQIVKLTLQDGTVEQATFKFYQSPIMKITQMGPESDSYSQGGLASSGGVINIDVKGRNLKSDATFTVYKNGLSGMVASGPLGVSGFPDEVVISLPGSIAAGTYTVAVLRKNIVNGQNIVYGTCTLNITP